MHAVDEEMLVQISRLVLRRPADCLTKLKGHLRERMITQDDDTTPRLWSSPTNAGLGLLYSASEGAVDLHYSARNPTGNPRAPFLVRPDSSYAISVSCLCLFDPATLETCQGC